MITFYRDDTVVVTSAYLDIDGERYRLAELDYVWHREVRPTWRVRGRTAGRGVLNIIMILAGFVGAIILISIISAAWTESHLADTVALPRNTLILLAVVLILMGFIAPIWEWMLHRVDESYDKGDAIYEVWAQTRGREVLLLRFDDVTRFGKIYRAIERALEYRAP